VLNVTADHLGIKGIDTVEDLARVKSVVVENVKRRGHSILNADDPLTVKMARHAGGRVSWFSNQSDAATRDPIQSHIAAGGMAVLRANDTIILHRDGERIPVVAVTEMPSTLGGIADFNVLNALAATAMTAAHGVPVETIAGALRAFATSFEDSPGRLNVLDAHGVRIIVDYAHNPAAISALGRMVGLMRSGAMRTFGMVSIPGDRRDCDLIEMGVLAAGIFDEIMFREAPDGRGRPAGSINALMSQGALSTGMASECVHRLVGEEAATDECLRRARPGDLVVLMPTDVDGIWDRVRRFAADPAPPCEAVQLELEAAHG
jgi:cyanophycin synthetase